jgi:hypothetical protein
LSDERKTRLASGPASGCGRGIDGDIDVATHLEAVPQPSKIKGPFKLAAIGELLYSHPMANCDDQEFQAVAKLVRTADLTIAEQEGLAVLYEGRLPLRYRLITPDAFLQNLNSHASRYYSSVMATQPNSEVAARADEGEIHQWARVQGVPDSACSI